MELRDAKIRLEILLKDGCNCPECMRNKEAYKTVLQELKNSQNKNDKLLQKNIEYDKTLEKLQKETIWRKKIEDIKSKYKLKYEEHKAVADKQFEEIGTRDCFDNELAIRDLGAIKVCEELLEDKEEIDNVKNKR